MNYTLFESSPDEYGCTLSIRENNNGDIVMQVSRDGLALADAILTDSEVQMMRTALVA